MKSLLLVSATLFSLSVLAGGSGGGGILTQMRVQGSPEVVYHLGSSNGSVKFAYGQWLSNGWKIEKIAMPESEVSTDPSVFEALFKSKETKVWERIKPSL